MQRRLALTLVLTCMLGVGAAACSSDSGGSASTESTPTSDSTAPSAPLGTIPVASVPVPTDAAPTSSCPVGRWALTNEDLADFYAVVGTQNGLTFEVEGEAVFELTDAGTFSYQFSDYALSTLIGGSSTRVALVGDIGGNFTADGGRFQTTTVEPNVTATATVNGATVDATAMLGNLLAEFPFNNAAYACVGEDLEVDFEVPGSTVHVVLSPAT